MANDPSKSDPNRRPTSPAAGTQPAARNNNKPPTPDQPKGGDSKAAPRSQEPENRNAAGTKPVTPKPYGQSDASRPAPPQTRVADKPTADVRNSGQAKPGSEPSRGGQNRPSAPGKQSPTGKAEAPTRSTQAPTGKTDTPVPGKQGPAGKPGPASRSTPGPVGKTESSGRSATPPKPNVQKPDSRGSTVPSATIPGRPAGRPGTPPQPSQPANKGGPQRSPNGSHKAPAASPTGKHPQGVPTAKGEAASTARPAVPRTETAPAPITEIIIPEQITVRELAEKMRRSPIEVIKTLMNYGIMVPITQSIDFDTAAVVGEELGITVKPVPPPEPEVKPVEQVEAPKTLRQKILADERPEQLTVRPPIVTVLGHVDHGKTTLLDAIRETRVVEGEVGGITQHIGAYQVERGGRKITFLDTPGHEAFTAMRARGAQVTDIAVLVVAADDGVMPQTKEAIAHARAAGVPIIVALNKIDKPTSNPERVKQELADNGLLIEEYGGDVICVPVSAKFRRGIDDLLENILLVADIDPLLANPTGECKGTVIESRLDKTRGPIATLLVQNGTLRPGDAVVVGTTYGKLRALYDDKGQPINAAPPSTPTVVSGLADVPAAGDIFQVVEDERTARAIAAERQERQRAESAAAAAPKITSLETIFAQAEAGTAKELNIILKADVQGSIEPIVNSLLKLGDEKLKVKILHQATGSINESDVMLAAASKAIILGFSVNVDPTAQHSAEAAGVDIRVYNIIYELIEDVQKALAGLLEPVYKETITGHAEIRAVFRISKVGKVAGCYVTDGELQRNSMARIKRGGQVLKEDKIISLKRFQEDVTEVKAGFECGLSFGNFNEFEVGDIIEGYKKEKVS